MMNSFIGDVIIIIFVYRIVGEVEVDFGYVFCFWLLVWVGGQSAHPLLEQKNLQRGQALYQHIQPQIKLQPI